MVFYLPADDVIFEQIVSACLDMFAVADFAVVVVAVAGMKAVHIVDRFPCYPMLPTCCLGVLFVGTNDWLWSFYSL